MNILRSVQETLLSDQFIVRECMRQFHEALGTVKPRYSEIMPDGAFQRGVTLKFGRGVRQFSIDAFADGGALKKRFSELVEQIVSDCPQTEKYRILQLVTYPLPCSGQMQRCLFGGISIRLSNWQDESFDQFRIDVGYTFEPLI